MSLAALKPRIWPNCTYNFLQHLLSWVKHAKRVIRCPFNWFFIFWQQNQFSPFPPSISLFRYALYITECKSLALFCSVSIVPTFKTPMEVLSVPILVSSLLCKVVPSPTSTFGFLLLPRKLKLFQVTHWMRLSPLHLFLQKLSEDHLQLSLQFIYFLAYFL